ncbi:hypothetical protein Tsubulata_034292 [Turnera subulata]|uniref:Uncharacterized protein n=1 Tax=Turnera subulata TaxID=218843 RepID=A0A9Q0F1M3_9ROSI|nr:hypothetical protein Tsubulata_034292 [Turnera subulata]
MFGLGELSFTGRRWFPIGTIRPAHEVIGGIAYDYTTRIRPPFDDLIGYDLDCPKWRYLTVPANCSAKCSKMKNNSVGLAKNNPCKDARGIGKGRGAGSLGLGETPRSPPAALSGWQWTATPSVEIGEQPIPTEVLGDVSHDWPQIEF